MPVEIKELVIRAIAGAERAAAEGAEDGGSERDDDAIVKECVKQVLRILEKAKER